MATAPCPYPGLCGEGQGNKQSREMKKVSLARKTNEFQVVEKTAEKASEIVRLVLLKGNHVLYSETTPPIKGSI